MTAETAEELLTMINNTPGGDSHILHRVKEMCLSELGLPSGHGGGGVGVEGKVQNSDTERAERFRQQGRDLPAADVSLADDSSAGREADAEAPADPA